MLERFFARQAPPVPVLVGLLPLHSARHAEFLHNEVPGITVPDRVRARCARRASAGCARASRWPRASCATCAGRYAGAYLMPSFGRFEVVAEVLDALH